MRTGNQKIKKQRTFDQCIEKPEKGKKETSLSAWEVAFCFASSSHKIFTKTQQIQNFSNVFFLSFFLAGHVSLRWEVGISLRREWIWCIILTPSFSRCFRQDPDRSTCGLGFKRVLQQIYAKWIRSRKASDFLWSPFAFGSQIYWNIMNKTA